MVPVVVGSTGRRTTPTATAEEEEEEAACALPPDTRSMVGICVWYTTEAAKSRGRVIGPQERPSYPSLLIPL